MTQLRSTKLRKDSTNIDGRRFGVRSQTKADGAVAVGGWTTQEALGEASTWPLDVDVLLLCRMVCTGRNWRVTAFQSAYLLTAFHADLIA